MIHSRFLDVSPAVTVFFLAFDPTRPVCHGALKEVGFYSCKRFRSDISVLMLVSLLLSYD